MLFSFSMHGSSVIPKSKWHWVYSDQVIYKVLMNPGMRCILGGINIVSALVWRINIETMLKQHQVSAEVLKCVLRSQDVHTGHEPHTRAWPLCQWPEKQRCYTQVEAVLSVSLPVTKIAVTLSVFTWFWQIYIIQKAQNVSFLNLWKLVHAKKPLGPDLRNLIHAKISTTIVLMIA